jgi:glutamate formiminotransferase/formiminotetrahydrofolate cyclodeaminase
MKIVECVPNFSEGRDQGVIDAITGEIEKVDGVTLVDVDPGADTNRTVVTFVGNPDASVEAAFQAIKKASELIDMSKHSGAHPRHGACDVCPFVPVAGVTMEDCAELAHSLGKRVGEELGLPGYYYEHAALREEWQSLAVVRKGEYEALPAKMKDPDFQPDFGPAEFNPKFGVVTIGAREFLIAFNVNLNTKNRRAALELAFHVREMGRAKRDENGEIIRDENGVSIKIPGKFKHVRGIGWYIDEYQMAQVSMNLTNYKVSPPHLVFDELCEEAMRRGMRVTGAELVGVIPLEAMLEAGRHYYARQHRSPGQPEAELVRMAIQSMGLNEITPFDPADKIIEYRIGGVSRPLIAMSGQGFADELSTDSPAPGGGSVAALCGSLGGALAAMVANLSIGKAGYEEVHDDMCALAVRGQELKDFFLRAVDDDTHAFNKVMDCFRMKGKSDEEKAAKEAAIQEATKGATEVPMTVLERTAEVAMLALDAAKRGNQNSLSDAGVAGSVSRAAAEGAFYNVLINLKEITDESYVAEMRDRAEKALAETRGIADEIREVTLAGIS